MLDKARPSFVCTKCGYNLNKTSSELEATRTFPRSYVECAATFEAKINFEEGAKYMDRVLLDIDREFGNLSSNTTFKLLTSNRNRIHQDCRTPWIYFTNTSLRVEPSLAYPR